MGIVTQIIGIAAFGWLFLAAICFGVIAGKRFWIWSMRRRHYQGCYRNLVLHAEMEARRAGR